MLVTVLSVAYNSEATIARTIESVLNQTYDNIEYIIIDGASTDKTAEIACSYQKAFDEREGRSLLVISEPDQGMYDALNKGARLAHGELVGQINADDWYELDAVEKMAGFYEQERYDVAWGDLRIVKPTGNMIKHARIGRFWTTAGWCHPSMFSRREALLEFPYPCENMYDDFDYVTRVHLARRKICTLNEVIANFSFGGMSTKKSLKETWKRIQVKWYGYKKYGMSPLYWLYCVGMEMAKYFAG